VNEEVLSKFGMLADEVDALNKKVKSGERGPANLIFYKYCELNESVAKLWDESMKDLGSLGLEELEKALRGPRPRLGRETALVLLDQFMTLAELTQFWLAESARRLEKREDGDGETIDRVARRLFAVSNAARVQLAQVAKADEMMRGV
jgi:hypothetical protein